MRNHPFIRTLFPLLVILFLCLLIGMVCTALIVYYQDLSWQNAGLESLVVVSVWLIVLYYSWFVPIYLNVWQAKLAFGLFQQGLSLSMMYLFLIPFRIIEEDLFVSQLPLLAVTGTLVWIIGMQWYGMQSQEEEDHPDELSEEGFAGELEPVREEKQEILQNISVKDGSHIHIIPVETIFYIQACGDYVNIFTGEGQFIKEQTMKSLEATLPDPFIRIHRSTIINSFHLLRIELFGKENYHVQLKNGTTLKASLSGYKLLKNQLLL